ncbi:helix-turn-helix domain-containing protein [Plantactinospora siamensis]|uniref:Helix-turn-helix domain-containing protein n=1 Tax=Plantactinospora siamensis TaxID=555372 RepID=A0ABV6NR65_9ACTN
MSWEIVRPDATSLRGLAHPLRVKMLTALREHGPATATLLAQRLGQSSGVTSYHLRQLAQHGFVVEDPDRGAGRERWWKAAHRGTSLGYEVSREAPGDVETYLRAVAALYIDRIDHWLSEWPALQGDWDGDWEGTGTLSDQRLRLTPAESRELKEEILALVERYRKDDPDSPAPPGTEPVILQWQVMPFIRAAGPEGGERAEDRS